MVGFVEDEQTFSILTSMKDKSCNKLGLHLDTIICMFTQKFILKKVSLITRLLQLGRIAKSGLVLLLSSFSSFHNTKLNCSCFHDLDKFGDCASDCAWFLIRLWGLLIFGCDCGTVNCIGQSPISNWGSTPPQSVYNLCLVLRFGFATMSIVFVSPSFSAPEPRSALVFLVGAC